MDQLLSANDEEDIESFSLSSSSDCNDFECIDDQNDWDPDTKKDEIHVTIMKVLKNPLFDESTLDSEVINDDSYWCRSNPLFEDNLDEYLASTTSECVVGGSRKSQSNAKVDNCSFEDVKPDFIVSRLNERCDNTCTNELVYQHVIEKIVH